MLNGGSRKVRTLEELRQRLSGFPVFIGFSDELREGGREEKWEEMLSEGRETEQHLVKQRMKDTLSSKSY